MFHTRKILMSITILSYQPASRLRAAGWLFLIPLLFAGCGDSSIAPVTGIVRLDGQPLDGGQVVFTPAAGRAARGTIQPDGTFTLGTMSDSDGARIGLHKVSVSYTGAGGPSVPNFDGPDRAPAKPKVPAYYAAGDTSGLTFEVKAGANNAEFDLKSK